MSGSLRAIENMSNAELDELANRQDKRRAQQLPEFSDEALALEFASRHAGDLRYVSKWGKWLRWTGTHWQHDDTLLAYDLARAVCRESAARRKGKVAAKTASAGTVAAVERLARADRRLAATVDQWDANDWVLNTPGGTVCLKSCSIRAPDPKDFCTRITTVAPGGDCPTWRRFLARHRQRFCASTISSPDDRV